MKQNTLPSLEGLSSTRCTFTFRVAFDDIQAIQSELLELTSRIQENNKSIDESQGILEKHSREIKSLDKKIVTRRKALEKLRSKGGKQGPSSKRKRLISVVENSLDIDITTNDVSIEVVSTPREGFKSPSPRKRKRFAGIWNASSISLCSTEETETAHALKRARVDIDDGEVAGGGENITF